MVNRNTPLAALFATFATTAAVALGAVPLCAQLAPAPQSMPKLGSVDARYVSYNVEAVEVTGGRFWKPYKDRGHSDGQKTQPNQPAGMDAALFQYRSPINLSNPKLRNFAKALAPAFLRVSGTWRNSTFFQEDDKAALATPPDGFKGVMTRAEWKGVVDFAKATDGQLVTSVAMSAGTRDADGKWTATQAKAFFDFTKSIGGRIVATEFMNEPTFAVVGGAPQGYNAAAYARDAKAFGEFLRKESPSTLYLGPGGIGEGGVPGISGAGMSSFVKTPDMMKETGPIYDVFSYHFYQSVSRRCGGPKNAATVDQAMSTEWLNRNAKSEAFYGEERDQYLPGKPLWLTETGEAGCGGDPFAAEFADSFRFMDQLGILAQKGVKAVMVNTLVSSDYGLVDEDTLEPRPNYWAALLWKRTMGTTVLDPGLKADPPIRAYAHCAVQGHGAVALLVINTNKEAQANIQLPMTALQYTLTSDSLESRSVKLNGAELMPPANGVPPAFKGVAVAKGELNLPARSISFLLFPRAKNSSCD